MKRIKKFLGTILFIISVCAILSLLNFAFSNPYLTETELFLKGWPLMVFVIVGLSLSIPMIRGDL